MSGKDTRVAVVTGANRGLGRAAAHRLLDAGFTVIACARDPSSARRDEDHPQLRWYQLDITEPASVAAWACELRDAGGHVDVLINNAGAHYDTAQRATDPDFEIVENAFAVNVLGAWRTTAALNPLIRSGGRIVNVSSGAGSFAETDGSGGVPAYSVSKAALNMLTIKLAAELAHRHIAVNAVCPGWVATDMGGYGGRPPTEAAAGIIWAATLPAPAPSGGFFRDGRPIGW